MKAKPFIGGYRQDRVLLVRIGEQQHVLLNVVDGVRTAPVDGLIVDRYGPWTPFTPTEELRDRVQHLLDTPGRIVALDQVGSNEPPVTGPAPTRQDFVDMLQRADLAVTDMLPDQQSFADEPDFLQSCLLDVVPQMQAAGIVVDDPSAFCALMHLERTGIMPRGQDVPLSYPEAPEAPAAETGEPQPMGQPGGQATTDQQPGFDFAADPAPADPNAVPASPSPSAEPDADEMDMSTMPMNPTDPPMNPMMKSCIGKPNKPPRDPNTVGKPGPPLPAV